MKQGIFVFVFVFVLLAACTPNTSMPLETSEPTITDTSTPMPTFTRMVIPTPIRYPTRTPYISPTAIISPTKTPYPTITLPPYPTPDEDFSLSPASISPTEKWIAWQINCDSIGSLQFSCLQFIKQDGTKIWSFKKDELENKLNLNFYVNVAHWSGDNKFVYLTINPMDLDLFSSQLTNGIIKFSLVNGLYSYIITPNFSSRENSLPSFYYFAFSNNSQWLTYAIKIEHSLNFTLLDLYSGEVEYFSTIVDENSIIEEISWSPNDKFIVVSVAENASELRSSVDFSVFLITVEDQSIKNILAHADKYLIFPEWVSNKEVQYYYADQIGNDRKLILNIETGEVTEMDE